MPLCCGGCYEGYRAGEIDQENPAAFKEFHEECADESAHGEGSLGAG